MIDIFSLCVISLVIFISSQALLGAISEQEAEIKKSIGAVGLKLELVIKAQEAQINTLERLLIDVNQQPYIDYKLNGDSK